MSTRTKWRNHVRAWRASGETAASYCRRHHLNPRTLSWWAWKLGIEAGEPESDELPSSANFVELAPLQLAGGRFEIEVGTLVLRVPFDFDELALRRLLDHLEARR